MPKIENLKDFEPSLNYESRLDVVNCITCKEAIIKHSIYIYPIASDIYKHKPSKYFGIYSNKKVDTISEIKGVCEVDENENISAIWFNSDMTTRENLITIVKAKTEAFPDFRPIQVFVLDNFRDGINFKKGTPGGMFGCKKYFNFDNEIKNIDELVKIIHNKTWNDFK